MKLLAAGAAVVLLATSAPAAPAVPRRTWSEIRGAGDSRAAGDVNGDGAPDVVVSRGGLVQPPRRGRTWVVFGPWRRDHAVDVAALGSGGFVIEGGENDLAAESAGAGDVNGDGLDDVVVGAPGGASGKGAAFVIFGKDDSSPVSLSTFAAGPAPGGFRISGPSDFSLAGWSVAGAGDVNGDGLDDVVVAAPFAGSAYVVFGKASTSPVDLALFDLNAHGAAGYRIDFPAPEDSDGTAVAGGGDFNGDGLSDVVVGVVPDWYESPGTAYVVFGKRTPDPINVTALGPRGFEIRGDEPGDTTGYAVANAGDVDGDGFDDVLVGAPRAGLHAPGRAALVFGGAMPTDVDVPDLGERGFMIGGGPDGENVGQAVGGGHDVNGDGRDDLLIGARNASRNDKEMSGSVYVVYGRAGGGRVRIDALGRGVGYRVDGRLGAPRRCDRPDWSWCPGDWLGHSVSGIADVTGDGLADVVAGAYAAGKHRLGRSYVIRGR